MKGILKLFLWRLLDIFGINALCRLANRHKAIILWYHGICDDNFNLTKRHLPKSIFRKQLGYIKGKGYTFVSMSELVDTIQNKGKIDKLIVLTFDDGFKNICENAYPIMKESGAKGCFYLVSSLIGKDQLLWTDQVEMVIRNQKKGDYQFRFKEEIINYNIQDDNSYEHVAEDIKAKLRMLPDKERHEHMKQFTNLDLTGVPKEFIIANWEQIKKLDPDLIEIGSHTKRHPNCVNLTSNDELEDEINNSKTDIEDQLGHKIRHFCYPAGSHDDRIISKVMEYGYDSAVTTIQGFNNENSDLYKLKRIPASEQFLLFKASISGSYNIARKIKAIIT
jgi:peptidoglycan/xylan/chitin deacetylase (PgdA/CDA1 family)